MAGSHARNYCITYPVCNPGENERMHYSRLEDKKEQVIVDSVFAAKTAEMLFVQQEFLF